MYIPSHFRMDDAGKLAAFMQQHSFATFITHDGAAPFASHLPMLYRPEGGPHGSLVSHLARANPQWQHFASGGEALAIFHGPHAYISPSWYEAELAVPTWNYAAVHAYGVPTIMSERERVAALLQETIATFEASFAQPWPGVLPEEYRDRMMQGIVAFEMPIARLEGKYKLGQNRPPADVRKVYQSLAQSPDAGDRALAQLMADEGHVPANE